MAIINCPECGNKVSTRAEECPNCGYPLQSNITDQHANNINIQGKHDDEPDKSNGNKKLWFLIIALAVIVIGFGLGGYLYYKNSQMQKIESLKLKIEQDSIAKVNRMTRDMTMFELHGPVKSVQGNNGFLDADFLRCENFVFKFDNEGNWDNKNAFKDYYIELVSQYGDGWEGIVEFDSDNQLSVIEEQNISVALSKVFGLEWHNGKIKSIYFSQCCPSESYNTEIVYSRTTPYIIQQMSQVYDISSFGSFLTNIKTYSDVIFDEYHNWISRTCIIESTYESIDHKKTENTQKIIENRRIEYYSLKDIEL